jgi:hypothetical protein
MEGSAMSDGDDDAGGFPLSVFQSPRAYVNHAELLEGMTSLSLAERL